MISETLKIDTFYGPVDLLIITKILQKNQENMGTSWQILSSGIWEFGKSKTLTFFRKGGRRGMIEIRPNNSWKSWTWISYLPEHMKLNFGNGTKKRRNFVQWNYLHFWFLLKNSKVQKSWYYFRLINITFGQLMALSVHSWHSIRLSDHGGAPPTPPTHPPPPTAAPAPWSESRIGCQEWTDKAIH